jgi:hypothetical protein
MRCWKLKPPCFSRSPQKALGWWLGWLGCEDTSNLDWLGKRKCNPIQQERDPITVGAGRDQIWWIGQYPITPQWNMGRLNQTPVNGICCLSVMYLRYYSWTKRYPLSLRNVFTLYFVNQTLGKYGPCWYSIISSGFMISVWWQSWFRC